MKFKALLLAVIAVLFAGVSQAQIDSTANLNVTVNISVNNTISLSETGGNLVFNNSTGVTNNVTFTAAYNLGPATTIKLYTYFSSSAAALTAGTSQIPSTAIQANFTTQVGSSSGQPCGKSYGVGNGVVDGSTCEQAWLASTGSSTLNPSGTNHGTATATYGLALINYAGNGLHLAAGNYSGTLNAVVIST